MMSDRTRFRPDQIDSTVFLATGVCIRGDVTIGARSSVWFQAVIRGDTEQVMIGAQTNIQDACVLHADPGFPCLLGDRVTVGHAAIVHGAEVSDEVMIGIRAVLLNGVRVGTGSVIAAGAVVPEGTEIPPGSLVMGVPGRVVREVDDELRGRIVHAADHYVTLAGAYRDSSA